MDNTDPQQMWKMPLAAPAWLFFGVSLGLLPALTVAAELVFGTALLPATLFVLVMGFGLRGVLVHYPHRTFGLCNGITLTRAAMGAFLAGAIVAPASAVWPVFGIALVAFALDGADGWLARRSGLSSAFGARFDMEVDALLAGVLALILLARGDVGPEILILGFTRYAFVLCSLWMPRLRAQLPDSFRRKTICVIQIATLIVLLCPLTPVWLMHPVSLTAAVLLLWSFATDILWLLRRG